MRGLILAAGFGTRLAPITSSVPKALVPVCSRPLLQHCLESMHSQGFGPLLVNSHHLHEQLAEFRERSAVAFEISHETGAIKGTGGALAYARRFLGSDRDFFVCNVEPLKVLPLERLRETFRSRKLDCGLVGVPAQGDGTLFGDPANGKYAGTRADKLDMERVAHSYYTGVAFYSRRFLELVRDDDFSIVPVWRRAQDAGLGVDVLMTPPGVYWRDVGTPRELALVHWDAIDGRDDAGVPAGMEVDRAGGRVVPCSMDASERARVGRQVWCELEQVAAGCTLENCVVMAGAQLQPGRAYVNVICTQWGECAIQ